MLQRTWSLESQASLRVIGVHGATADAIEFYNAGPDHYFTTAAPAEVAMLDAGVVVKSWPEAVHRLGAVTTRCCRWRLSGAAVRRCVGPLEAAVGGVS